MVASPVSFEALSPVKDAFATSFSGEVLNPQLYFVGGMIDYIIINGQVCKRGVNMGDLQWEAPLVGMDGVGNYEVAPFVMEVDGVQTFYDRLNKRLLQHTRWNMGLCINSIRKMLICLDLIAMPWEQIWRWKHAETCQKPMLIGC